MPISDYVPDFNESNLSTYYRSVLGVPVRKRVMIIVLVVFVLFLIFVCALMISKYGKHSGKNTRTSFAPYVPLVNSINSSVDPCFNFYNFTCGLWAENEVVQEIEKNQITTFTVLQNFVNNKKRSIIENAHISKKFPRVVNDAIEFYKICLFKNNTNPHNDIAYLLNYFEELMNGWPILNMKLWKDKDFNWLKASAYLFKTLHIETIAGIYSITDNYDTTRKIIYIKPPVYDGQYNSLESPFAFNMMYVTLTSLEHSSIDISDDVVNEIDVIQKTEKRWLSYFSNSSLNKNQTLMSLKELQEQMPDFDWLKYVQIIMNDTLKEINEYVSVNDIVLVENLEFLKRSISSFQLDTFTKFELANLFGWFVVQKIWHFIPGLLWQYCQSSQYSVDECKEVEKSKCFDTLFEWYECGIDYLYVQNSSHSGVADGKILVHYVKEALKSLLSTSDWMDETTKSAALQKLNAMQSIIGFPSYLQNKAEYSEMYKGFPKVTPSLLETYFKIISYYTSSFIKELKEPKVKPLYISARSITDVSAYYDLQRNVFTLPLSMYNPPFYHYGGPWYLNFGSLGAIIGHEIMHGFDNMGCQRGPTGNLENWWSNTTSSEYKYRSKCFATQYATHKNLNNTANLGISTLNEDIADNEGLKLAYLAYKQWEKDNAFEKSALENFTSEQLFFVSYGSIWCKKENLSFSHYLFDKQHSAAYVRVNKVVSNLKYFSHAFQCSKGTPMNPLKKCTIW
ncbi:neprilysin-1 [Caerostris darwini]|uniref:Neprilysin-1 n=1 Tax=Caerostris darwini TaxID=1538125 RepID=A0AAV4X0U7_9ARAC|nr:neprilysin-1 [Caerostris darwini]